MRNRIADRMADGARSKRPITETNRDVGMKKRRIKEIREIRAAGNTNIGMRNIEMSIAMIVITAVRLNITGRELNSERTLMTLRPLIRVTVSDRNGTCLTAFAV
jgi:hypothetical protein